MTDQDTGQLSVMQKLQIVFLTRKRYFQKNLASHDITVKQFFLLERLAERDFMYPAEIASQLFCDRPTVTVIVRNMEKQGWVERQQDTQNRRRSRVSTTKAGKVKLVAIQRSAWGSIVSTLDPLSCFDEQELDEFERLVDKLYKHIKEISQEPQ
ncbi:MAG: MarR family transcriptional regulator [Chloroflexi bacterium]|nr:MarR family transcriptional regulator [Chloroflexota bacterium]